MRTIMLFRVSYPRKLPMSENTKLIPRQAAPDLVLDLVGGGSFSLKDARPENFSLLIFYRGWHCPICRIQLLEAQSRLYDFRRRGVQVVAISTDDRQRAEQSTKRWGLDRLDVAFGLSLAQAREWGLYISTSRGQTSTGVEEPAKFNEPGLFLIKPDQTIYYASVQTAPFARSSLSDIIKMIDYVLENDYPARGEVNSD